ncbi:MAG: hypothetical protein LBC11_03180 [Puniceicoccales bacterium]|jgi:hypothetical protein|nr:hypothetical protein [Puniceicoccales bacterium]
MKNFSKKDRCLQNTRSNFRRKLLKKVRKFSTAVKDFTRNALATKLPKIIEVLKAMSKHVAKVTTSLAAKIVKTYKTAKGKAKNALATKLPKIIEVSKAMSKYVTEVTILLAARIIQMYKTAKGKAGKIVEKSGHAKTGLVSAISNFRKQFPKVISQIAHLLKLAFVVSLQVTKVGVMYTVDWACLLVIKGGSVVRSCLIKSRSLIKSGNQKLTNALKFLLSASIFASQMTCRGLLFLCLSVKNTIRKVCNSILVSIRTLGQSVKKFVNAAVKAITYPFISFHSFLKKSANASRTTCISYATRLQSSVSNIRESLRAQFSSLKAQFSYGNVLSVLQKPAVVLPLAFTAIAFVGLKTYDGQVSKVEYARAALAVKHEKDLLRQKRNVLHGYENENIASKRKRTKDNRAFVQASPSRSVGYTDLQKAVDSFFHSHRVSEVMCDKNSCKIKVDDRIIDGSGPIGADSTVFISEVNGDHIVFADASGNRYVKSIDSLFNQ